MAIKDLRALEGMPDRETFADEIFGFHAQQAVEKAIKGWLSLIGKRYPRTHDLEELLALLEENGEVVPHSFKRLVELSDFAVQLRCESYEYDEAELDREAITRDVRDTVQHVKSRVATG